MTVIDYNKISNANKTQTSNIIEDIIEREKTSREHYIPYHAISRPTKASKDYLKQKKIFIG